MYCKLTNIAEKKGMQAAQEIEDRTVFCETHNKHCRLVTGSHKCPCCGKKICLCNYVL